MYNDLATAELELLRNDIFDLDFHLPPRLEAELDRGHLPGEAADDELFHHIVARRVEPRARADNRNRTRLQHGAQGLVHRHRVIRGFAVSGVP